ncbi:MAG: hypothetical protein M1269_03500 [Chloroflexi bacterium]|nr:hypothetical protein [Chloroflexota bacterium]
MGGGGSDSDDSGGSGGNPIINILNAIFSGMNSGQTNNQRAVEVNNKAVEYEKKGENEIAYKLYCEAFRLDPNNKVIRKNITVAAATLGNKAYSEGNFTLAVQKYKEALAYNPNENDAKVLRRNLSKAFAELGNKACREGNITLAIQKYNEALTYDPDNKDIRDGLQIAEQKLADKNRIAEIKPKVEKIIDQIAAEMGSQGAYGAPGGGQSGGTSSGSGDSSAVDLTFLDPNKPIVVDPNVVKGNPRRIPVQPGSCTPKGENYDKGFDDLRKGDIASAIEYFKKAEAENPDNPLVRNAMDLAKDLAKVREDAKKSQEERERFTNARYSFIDATDALRKGDIENACELFHRAMITNPNDKELMETTRTMQKYLYWARKAKPSAAASEDEKKFYTAVADYSGQAMTFLILKDYKFALEALDNADKLFADQCFFEDVQTAAGKPKPEGEAAKSDANNRAMMRVGLGDVRWQVLQALEQSSKSNNP